MRQLILDRIMEFVNDGFDLSELELNNPTTVKKLQKLPDEELLSIFEEIVGFQG